LARQGNEIVGLPIDVINAIGNDAGFTANVQLVAINNVVSSLTDNSADLIMVPRQAVQGDKRAIEFSQPAFTWSEALIVRSDDQTAYVSLADLRPEQTSKGVGVQMSYAPINA